MPKFVGKAAAFVALCAGVYWHVDPLICMGRAALAYVLGMIGYQVWHAAVASQTPMETVSVEAPKLEVVEGHQSKAA